jgi:metallo-beta-lactamase family protein
MLLAGRRPIAQSAAMDSMQLRFLGANATVTGSRTLVELGHRRLLVDCGLFQGFKSLRLKNWAPAPVPAREIDAVVLTHAHLDHSGYLPRLVAQGFRGPIFCTAATKALCEVLLPDSGRLQEEEAEYANRKGSSKHAPALPLYDEAQARACLRQMQAVEFLADFEALPGLRASLHAEGHLLGAAGVLLSAPAGSVYFSGDVGRPNDPVLLPPSPPPGSDWLVVESTYGNRSHPGEDTRSALAQVLRRVLARGGVVVVPAFAVGRAQALLHLVAQLFESGEVPTVPLYLNSPMAAQVTGLYRRFPALHRLDEAALAAMEKYVRVVASPDESRQVNARKGPMIIVSASGMATGGRVLHHLIAFAPDPRNAIVLTGFQAGGTRGAALANGARSIRIYGQDVAVNAEVVQLSAASGHADADELMAWMRSSARPPRRVFIVHGEPEAADTLRGRIERELHWPAHVPEYGEEARLQGARK